MYYSWLIISFLDFISLYGIKKALNYYMKRVLILDSNQRSALAATRSLGKRNVPVYTADDTINSLSGKSKFSIKYSQYPSPTTTPEEFILFLSQLTKELNIDIILPMTELTTMLLLDNSSSFTGISLPFTDIDTINSISDKISLMRLAESLDIPIPGTHYVDDPKNLQIDLNNLEYPIVLKPARSWLQLNETWVHTAVKFANTVAEAQNIINTDPVFINTPYMVQKCVSGSGQGLFALYDKGQALTFFCHKRLREKPPSGGVSVLSESVTVDEQLKRIAKRLLDHSDWHGIAMVEFKVADDGTPYLMEINTRFWGSLQLAIDAKVDFVWMLYQITCGNKIQVESRYTTGIRLRWILGDLDRLYILMKSNNFSIKEKLLAIPEFLLPSSHKTQHEVNRFHDMGPFIWELKQYIKWILKK